MELRELIGRIGQTYDRRLPMGSEAQQLLRRAAPELRQWVGSTYLTVGSGGKGNGAVCPWIAVFNEDETTTAQQGMYLVYLFAEDMKSVSLSLNQGVTEFRRATKDTGVPAREALFREAVAIRRGFDLLEITDLEASIDLRTRATLPVDYEYGNIVARTYDLAALPDEATMVSDLTRFLRLYELALEAREEGRQSGDVAITTPSRRKRVKKRIAIFKPKDAGEYRRAIAAREIVVTRRHEKLVEDYGRFLQERGFAIANNVHPRDLTADRDGVHWLVEAKMVRGGDAESAAREAMAQLIFYSNLYDDDRNPEDDARQLALFSEDIGPLFVSLFEKYTMAVVWQVGDRWDGSPVAVHYRLC
jgi:hypothetical protein